MRKKISYDEQRRGGSWVVWWTRLLEKGSEEVDMLKTCQKIGLKRKIEEVAR